MDMVEKETIRQRQRKNRQIFSMLMTIVVMFIICWGPLFVRPLLEYYSDNSAETWLFASVYVWYLQAAINPSIYFIFLRDFRKGVKILFCSKLAPTRGGDGNEVPMQHLQHPSSNQLLPINHPRRPRTPGGDSNHDPTCTPPHINTTSV